MIMLGAKKNVVNQILGDPEKEKSKDESQDSLGTCMQEFIDAVHAKDVEGAKAAFKACIVDLHSQE